MSRNRYLQIALITKRVRRLISAILIAFALLWESPPQVARADTTVCGPVSGIWTPAGNNYIVTCDVIVNAGATLTIQPNVIVKFSPSTSLQVNGTLIATGATFTSNSAPTAKGDWGRIYFTSSSVDAQFDVGGNYVSGSKIENSLIEWGGGWVEGALHIEGASPFIYLNIIRNNASSGIHATGRSIAKLVVIRQNNINNNELFGVGGGGIYVNLGSVSDNNIAGNAVTNNWDGSKGGGVYALSSTISGNTISGNGGTATGSCGGIYASSSTISNNTISGNTASNCGGVCAVGNSTVTNNTVENNAATYSAGGGICVEGGLVTANTIHGNSSPYQGGGIRAFQATVSNNSISENNGGVGGGIYAIDANLIENTLTDNYANSDGGGIYAYVSTNVTSNSIQNNTAGRGGGIFAEGDGIDNPTLNGNIVSGNTATSGAGIYALFAVLNGNTVTGNTANGNGGGIYAEGGTLTGNTISTNTVPSYGHGSGAYITNVTDFSYNDVQVNTAPSGTAGGISINGLSEFHYNNLHGNLPYEAEVISSSEVDATLNYWGLLPCLSIPAHIYDGHDAPGRGNLIYAPSLYSPVPVAQLDAPHAFNFNQGSSPGVLRWIPLPPLPNVGCRPPDYTGPELGYRIYYDTDSLCPPFDGTGLSAGDSPIDVGSASEIILPDAEDGGYFFAITAYDYLGRESHYTGFNWGLYIPMVNR